VIALRRKRVRDATNELFAKFAMRSHFEAELSVLAKERLHSAELKAGKDSDAVGALREAYRRILDEIARQIESVPKTKTSPLEQSAGTILEYLGNVQEVEAHPITSAL